MVSQWEKNTFFKQSQVWASCFMAFALHLVFHILILKYVLPIFEVSPDDDSNKIDYKETARVTACSWFTANPVHCLRSEHIYKQSPAIVYYQTGKEYMQVLNK